MSEETDLTTLAGLISLETGFIGAFDPNGAKWTDGWNHESVSAKK
jgi:hypothetical protein